VIDALTGGAALLLAATLLVAGLFKAWGVRAFAVAIHRLLPIHLPHRRALALALAPAVCVLEAAVAVALLCAPRGAVPVAWTVLAVTCGFVLVVLRAIHAGATCGCFPSLSDGVAGAVELTRAAGLTIVALGLVVGDLAGRAATPRSARSAAAAVLLACALCFAIWLARRASGVRTTEPGWFATAVTGRVRTNVLALPRRAAEVHGVERRRVLEAVRATPSMATLTEWLAGEGLQVDLRGSLVTRVSAHSAGVPMSLLVTVPRQPRLSVRLSFPWDGVRVVDVAVVAVVDGKGVSVVGGIVREQVSAAR
jgi:hypothetical protein